MLSKHLLITASIVALQCQGLHAANNGGWGRGGSAVEAESGLRAAAKPRIRARNRSQNAEDQSHEESFSHTNKNVHVMDENHRLDGDSSK